MRPKLLFVMLLLTLVWANPSFSQAVGSLNSSKDSSTPIVGSTPQILRIGPGDLLDIDVFDTAELSRKLRVNELAAISLPVGGDLHVGGLTAGEAAHAIEERFRRNDILKDPHVEVTVLEYATQGVTVFGEVKSPGVYPLLGSHGVLDLISAAGGMTANASKAVTVTHRTDPGHSVIVNIESKPGSTAAFNVDVYPGDTIMVSRAGVVYVLGEVGKPGGFLVENNDQLTVMQAIALAQGTTRTASLNNARLIRKTNTGLQQMSIALGKMLANKSPDKTLEDGDILFVPTSSAKHTLVVAESILPAAAGAALYHVP